MLYSDGGVIRDVGAQLHKIGVRANYCKKHTIWFGQNWVHFFENGILMGGKLGQKLVKRKSDFRGPAGTSTYDFGESTPPPSWYAFWQKNDMLLKWSIVKSTSELKPQRKACHLKDTALCDF